jgi:ferritin-like metal-binding protein YciE
MSTLKELYFGQLKDLYDAEHRMLDALPKLVSEASSPDLQEVLEEHLEETQLQIERLEQIFAAHDMEPERETCKAMKGLIAEGESELKDWNEPSVRDAALIASAQRVEHYEIAGYGSVRCFAQMLGFEDDAQLLGETLAEERAADSKLNDIAVGSVNRDALLAEENENVSSYRQNQENRSRSQDRF